MAANSIEFENYGTQSTTSLDDLDMIVWCTGWDHGYQSSVLPEYVWNKLYMPRETVKLVNEPLTEQLDATRTKYTFHVPPHMTKHDIKEYLTKIYCMDVVKVNTVNYEGKKKRVDQKLNLGSVWSLHYQ